MVIKSHRPSIAIPNIGLYEFLFSSKDLIYSQKPIFIDAVTGASLTHQQLRSESLRFGAGLQERFRFAKGDVLLIFSPNQYDYAIPILGALAVGGIVSPANPAYTVDELVHQLEICKAKAMIIHPIFMEVALKAAAARGIPKERILLFGGKEVNGILPYQALFSQREAELTRVDPDDLAFLNFSSGTTGKSKGVMLTQKNLVANISQVLTLDSAFIHRDRDVLAGVLPFFHIYGLTNLVLIAPFSGRTVVVFPKFDFEPFLAAVQKFRISYAHLVPPIILLLAKHPLVSKYDLSSLRLIISGAAPLPHTLGLEFKQRLTNVRLRQGYGMTEASPVTHMAPLDMEEEDYGTVGTLLPNVEAKVLDANGREVKVGEEGELLVRGPNIMKGYLNNPEATRATIEPDGFLRTGDVCRYDERGFFYIVDRVKELIKYKGFQVPPAELEGLLLTHPKIADCCVIGVYSSQQATELPRAYVVLRPNITDDKAQLEKEILEFVKSRVAHYKQLRGGVRFIDQIPKSVAGKILRRVLKEEAEKEDILNAKL
ncbi:uncharacterized protein VTP21DRAFT_1207 [Calcarisporiella thermophila]|uniref:uncharacterized protein n=1 Tax=Calcarisporiella thermophila TaxID=911321 RepID=UPI00374495E6